MRDVVQRVGGMVGGATLGSAIGLLASDFVCSLVWAICIGASAGAAFGLLRPSAVIFLLSGLPRK